MEHVGSSQGDVVAALQRAAADGPTPAAFTGAHVLQLIGTAMVGVALLFGSSMAGLGLGLAGAIAIAVALRLAPTPSTPGVAQFFDERTGLPTANAMPIVMRDERAITSLTGRLSVLMLEVHGAAEYFRSGEQPAAHAVMSAVVERLEAHAWAYPVGDAFGPLLFLHDPSTIVVVRRDVLGEESNQWFTERLLTTISEPVPWGADMIAPAISIGGASGPSPDGAAITALATMTGRDARAVGAGTVSIRRLDRRPAVATPPIEVAAASDQGAIGVFFEFPDPGGRVGIFEHLATLRSTFNRAVAAVAESGARPLIGTSVIALSHPAAATDLIQRASDVGMTGHVGIILPPDFPLNIDHRAAETVDQLASAGFLIMIDRRDSCDYLISLPQCPIDLVMVDLDFNELGGGSPAERALLASVDARHVGLALARMSVRVGAPEPVPSPAVSSPPGLEAHPPRQGMNGPGRGGRLAHLAKAGATSGR